MSRGVSLVARSRPGARPRWQMTTRPGTALVLGVAGLAFATVQVALFSTPPTWFQLAVAVFWGVVGAAYLASAAGQVWRARTERATRGGAPGGRAGSRSDRAAPDPDPDSLSTPLPDLVPVRPARARRAAAAAAGRRPDRRRRDDDLDPADDHVGDDVEDRYADDGYDDDGYDDDGYGDGADRGSGRGARSVPRARDGRPGPADRSGRRSADADEPVTLQQRRLPGAGPVRVGAPGASDASGPPGAPTGRPGPPTARPVPPAVTGLHGRAHPAAPPPRTAGSHATPRSGGPVPPGGAPRREVPPARVAPAPVAPASLSPAGSPPVRAAHARPAGPGAAGPPVDPSAPGRPGRHDPAAVRPPRDARPPADDRAVPGAPGPRVGPAPDERPPSAWRAPYGSWSGGPHAQESGAVAPRSTLSFGAGSPAPPSRPFPERPFPERPAPERAARERAAPERAAPDADADRDAERSGGRHATPVADPHRRADRHSLP